MSAAHIARLLGEVQAWPPGLTDELPAGPWVVAHVKPRQEKMLAANMRRAGIPGLLFLEQRVRTYLRQGVQRSLVPLLPGYLFLLAEPRVLDDIYATERVVRLIIAREQHDLRSDLRDLVALVTRADAPMLVRPEIVPGNVVQLNAGSMAGLRGVVMRRKGRNELVVNVRMLGTSVAVACAAADVEPG